MAVHESREADIGAERRWRTRVRWLALAATTVTGISTTLAQPFFPEYAEDRFKVSKIDSPRSTVVEEVAETPVTSVVVLVRRRPLPLLVWLRQGAQPHKWCPRHSGRF